MHIPSLAKIHQYLLKLSSGNENMDMSRADNAIKNWQNLPISNPKPDLHNINGHTKFEENPLKFTHVIARKRKYGWMDTRTTNVKTTVWLGIFFFFLIWVLWPFQEYFTYIKPIVQRWAKTGEPGKKTTWPSVSKAWLSHKPPKRGSNHSGEKLNGLKVNTPIH